MLDVIGNLLGTQRATERAIDHIASGIDALWHTDEEKAHEAQQARQAAFDRFLGWMEATKGSRLARRLIALTVVGMWAATLVVGIVLAVAAMWVDPTLTQVVVGDTVAEVMRNTPQAASDLLFQQALVQKDLVIWILAFYFGGPVVTDVGKAVVDRHFGKPRDD